MASGYRKRCKSPVTVQIAVYRMQAEGYILKCIDWFTLLGKKAELLRHWEETVTVLFVGAMVIHCVVIIEALHCSKLIHSLSKIVATLYMKKIMGDVLMPLLFMLAPENFIEALHCIQNGVHSVYGQNYGRCFKATAFHPCCRKFYRGTPLYSKWCPICIWTKLWEMFYCHCFSTWLQTLPLQTSRMI